MEEVNDEPSEYPSDSSPLSPIRVYRRDGHPRGRRRRSRGQSFNIQSRNLWESGGTVLQPGDDSGYEASPSSFSSSRTFTFDDNYFAMPNSTDNNNRPSGSSSSSGPSTPRHSGTATLGSLEDICDEEIGSNNAVSLSIPIIRNQSPVGRSFSPGSSYRNGFLSVSPLTMMANGHQRQRVESVPPAYFIDRRHTATQTEGSPPINSMVRHRRASSFMTAPLPDLLPPSVHLSRPRSISTSSFPGCDAWGHPIHQPELNQNLTVGTRLRSLSDAFEQNHRNELLRRNQNRPMEVKVADMLVSFFFYLLQPLIQDNTAGHGVNPSSSQTQANNGCCIL